MWDEFPFDLDDVQNSKHNVSYDITDEEVVFDGETCMAKLQNDSLKEITATNEEFFATKIFKTAIIDDSYLIIVMVTWVVWSLITRLCLWREIQVCYISISELGGDLFKETTPQEEYNEHLYLEQSNQLFHSWDSSVMELTYDKDPTTGQISI